jgi:uncharacterized membrane protein (DUF4010 family)
LDQIITFPHTDAALKILLAIGVGLLVGLEREAASKDVGVRTFALTSLLGLICQLIGANFAIGGLMCTLFLTGYISVRSIKLNRTLEITTSVALILTFVLGVIVAQGHVFTPVAASILMTMLLAWKTEIAAFAHGLRLDEIRSAVMLALLSFVIYPILPDQTIDQWNIFNPKEAWVTVLVLAGMSFGNYLLLKIYSTKGLFYSALLGGAINSSAAVTEVTNALKNDDNKVLPSALPILLMVTVAMFIRNLVVLGVFEPQAILIALAPLLGMTVAAVYFIYRAYQKKGQGVTPTNPLRVASPISLKRVLKFGAMFVLLQGAGTIAQRYLGNFGVLAVSLIGGLVSSASATAAAAKLASSGHISATVAGAATILSSISSAFVNLPLVYQETKDINLTKKLGWTTLMCILFGLILMAGVAFLQGWK